MRCILFQSSALLTMLSAIAVAQQAQGKGNHAARDAASSDRALIANALSAAPPSVSAHATVVGHDGRVLRKGTSDWVCMPDMPDVANNSPMCLDAPWRSFIDALMKKRTPTVAQLGFGYMLQEDMPVSNTDPYATAPADGNEWIPNSGPHIMVIVPDQRLLEGLPTDPKSGGPFVMWRGTPYAHIMVPAPRARTKP